MEIRVLDVDTQELRFHRVALRFLAVDLHDIFANKNNKTLAQTLERPKYRQLAEVIHQQYPHCLQMGLGEFLMMCKSAGDMVYKQFLNRYGDGVYCKFRIDADLKPRGLYSYWIDQHVQYIGRCRDSFEKRINRGYGHISPKNCYLDGRATNCHLNGLVNQYRDVVEFYICPLDDEEQIIQVEARLIQQWQPPWNIALKTA